MKVEYFDDIAPIVVTSHRGRLAYEKLLANLERAEALLASFDEFKWPEFGREVAAAPQCFGIITESQAEESYFQDYYAAWVKRIKSFIKNNEGRKQKKLQSLALDLKCLIRLYERHNKIVYLENAISTLQDCIREVYDNKNYWRAAVIKIANLLGLRRRPDLREVHRSHVRFLFKNMDDEAHAGTNGLNITRSTVFSHQLQSLCLLRKTFWTSWTRPWKNINIIPLLFAS